ncbi:MAG TPA: DnaJ domain-containing protein [Anaerolineales bacterium]|nr:DnaJ domain-containing protein [Anaerolineales bacterium]
MTNLDYYKILRLKSSATPKEIADAYRDLSILYRDNKDSTSKEIMKLIDEAYLVLQDPRNRAYYDLEQTIKLPESQDQSKFSEAENIINSWGANFTNNEQKYIDKIHMINKIMRVGIFVVGIIFVWSVIAFRFDISFLLVFGILFLRIMIWSIYRIKNPPPAPEVWGIE